MKWLMPLLMLCTVVLAGCGASVSSTHSTKHNSYTNVAQLNPSANTAQPNTLVVVRKNPLHQPGMGPLDKTLHDRSAIDKLYTDVLRVHHLDFASGSIDCPVDNGVSYTLTFKHGKSVVLVADAQDTGCRIVGIKNMSGSFFGLTNSFWSLLYKSLGIQQTS